MTLWPYVYSILSVFTPAGGRCGTWLGCGQAVACVCLSTSEARLSSSWAKEFNLNIIYWESDMIFSVYTIYMLTRRFIKCRKLWLFVEPVLPPKGSDTTWFEPSSASGLSLASSVLLHQPPSSGRPLPPPPLEMPERPGLDQWEAGTGQTIQSEPRCLCVSDCQLYTSCCYAPSLCRAHRSNVTVWVQSPGAGDQISSESSQSQCWTHTMVETHLCGIKDWVSSPLLSQLTGGSDISALSTNRRKQRWQQPMSAILGWTAAVKTMANRRQSYW